ncbi:competence protein ComGC [Anaerobranca californiensis DSM 14826]|uniref:Competence protein ComGC n=1 Tax=Anaerobranca californiensis DSM 14826 TaxID=1120989 RepID=A0A1M6NU65_9FIRM|nr:prepilin-type N-terminal cleavage/methylation domain-containing protein [Anaerobranca californiensis]SHJ99220.1 competence protein ComGC [Anaerobranca californiensis DSM 14826]
MLKNQKGFTLLEVLLVITLVGVILAITVPNVGIGSKKANDELCSSGKLIIEAAIEQYKLVEKVSDFNPDLQGEEDFIDHLIEKGYLKNRISCPNGGTYSYTGGKVQCSVCGEND